MAREPTAAELIAEKYQADGEHVVRDYRRLSFVKHVRLMRDRMGLAAGATVLDIGCGTGALLVELVQAGARASGIDTFEEAGGIDRRIVAARLREAGARAHVLEATAGAIPFRDEAFDLVVTIGMLEHIPPEARQRALPEMFRVVKAGGYLFLIAGPTNLTPYDQHVPGRPLSNWSSREKKLAASERAGRRQLLEVPWGISRKELRRALPGAEFHNLYGDYFALGGGNPGSFTLRPMGFLVWVKRRFGLHRLFGLGASMLYAVRQEHCHILAIRKPARP